MADLMELLSKISGNSAIVNNAAAGGYGKDKLSTALSYAGALSAPLAQMGQGQGIIPTILGAAGNVATLKNQRAYNKYLQQQALLGQQRQIKTDYGNAQIAKAGTGLNFIDPNTGEVTPFDLGFMQQMTGDIRKNNANPAIMNLIQTGQFNPDQSNPQEMAADYGDIPKTLLDRANAINDSTSTGQKLEQWMRPDLPGDLKSASETLPTIDGLSLQNDWSKGKPLQASAQKQQMITPSEAMQYAAPDWGTVLKGREGEQTNARGVFKNTEDSRHNKATEKTDLINANAHMLGSQASMVSAHRPVGGGGSAPDPLVQLNRADEVLRNQQGAVDAALKQMGINPDKNAGKLTGSLPETPNNGFRINQLAQQRDAIIQRRIGMMGGTPFGGQARQNLDSTTKALNNINSALDSWGSK